MSKPEGVRLEVGDRPINLTQVLKLSGSVLSGGEAKALIGEGRVRVNGQVEIRKRRQMARGDVVEIEGTHAHRVDLTDSVHRAWEMHALVLGPWSRSGVGNDFFVAHPFPFDLFPSRLQS